MDGWKHSRVSVWISHYCLAELHNFRQVNRNASRADGASCADRTHEFAQTRAEKKQNKKFASHNFSQTVNRQQQTTAALQHLSHRDGWRYGRPPSPSHLLSCFLELAGKCDFFQIFHISPRTSPLTGWNALCFVRAFRRFDVFNMAPAWYLSVYRQRCLLLWAVSLSLFLSFFSASANSSEPLKKIGGFHFLARIFI